MSESPKKTVSYRPAVVRAHDCFVTHFCNQLIKAGNALPVSELRKMAEERWKGMTIGEKRPYKEIAAQKREELGGLEMPAGQTMKVEGSRKRKRATKEVKGAKGPKRATTAFFFFAQDERANVKNKNPEFKVTEISKELGKMWREMSAKQKDKYLQLAAKDKKRYEEEKAAFESGKGSQGSGEEEEEED